jgi:hypothetical protein
LNEIIASFKKSNLIDKYRPISIDSGTRDRFFLFIKVCMDLWTPDINHENVIFVSRAMDLCTFWQEMFLSLAG